MCFKKRSFFDYINTEKNADLIDFFYFGVMSELKLYLVTNS